MRFRDFEQLRWSNNFCGVSTASTSKLAARGRLRWLRATLRRTSPTGPPRGRRTSMSCSSSHILDSRVGLSCTASCPSTSLLILLCPKKLEWEWAWMKSVHKSEALISCQSCAVRMLSSRQLGQDRPARCSSSRCPTLHQVEGKCDRKVVSMECWDVLWCRANFPWHPGNSRGWLKWKRRQFATDTLA